MSTLKYLLVNPDLLRQELRYQRKRFRQKTLMAIAWRLPEDLVYWAAIRVGAHATTGKYNHQIVPELNFMDALHRWDYK